MEYLDQVLKKLYPNGQLLRLASLVEANSQERELPTPFQGAVAVQITANQLPEKRASSQLDWYLLIESVEGVLYAKGNKCKWELPCIYQGCQAACCPFIKHIKKEDWEDLHHLLGTSVMRWLLLNCILFVQVASKCLMQVCGPVLRTQVDIVFPFAYNKKTAPTAGRTIKRKLEREAGMVVPSQSQMSIIPSWIPSRPTISQVAHSGHASVGIFPSSSSLVSLLPPLKKIRICHGEGHLPPKTVDVGRHQPLPAAPLALHAATIEEAPPSHLPKSQIALCSSSSSSSVLPILKKIRIQRRDPSGIVENIGTPISLTPYVPPITATDGTTMSTEPIPDTYEKAVDPVASTQTNVTVVDLVDTVGHPKRRRLRKRKTAAQTVDGRRSFDGSLLIPHDDIFYGHSGWTHFELRHPLMRSSHQDTVQAILATDVGTHFGESIQLEEFDALVQTMWQQHRQFRYSQALRSMLASDANHQPMATHGATDQHLVYRFVRKAVINVVPAQLLGSAHNWRVFFGTVQRYISSGRGRHFTLAEVMQSLKTSNCRWTQHLASLPLQTSLLARIVKWFFVQLIKPLIRQHFYVTETTYGRYRVFFYHKDTWQSMRSKMLKAICSASGHHPTPVLETVSDTTTVADQFLLQAKLRFIPKGSGASRPIMPTRTPSTRPKSFHDARLLLQTISSQYEEGLDAKASSDFHRKWLNFVRCRNGESAGSVAGPVYFVHADVEDAFGSILHERMIEILLHYRDVLPATLHVRHLTHLSPGGRRSRNFRLIPFFHEAEQWVQRLPPNCLVHDLANNETFDVDQLLRLTIRSILEVYVRHNNDRFLLRRGIPQGSRLSSSLCHIYYGHMVRQHLSEFLNHPDDLLVRVVDDFLYLTIDVDRARRFHACIHKGFPDYNAYVNITKSTTNLPPVDCSIPRPLSRPAWPSFCGLQFNTRTLELRGNYAKYRGTNIIDCISPPAGHPGQLLFKRLQAISTLKLEVMYLDSAINRKPTVVRTLYNASLMAAFRFHAIVTSMLCPRAFSWGRGRTANTAFLVRGIDECCRRIGIHMKQLRRRHSVRIAVTGPEARWICLQAFVRKLRRHREKYADVITPLTDLLAQSKAALTGDLTDRLGLWIGRRMPRPFRQMKKKVVKRGQ